MHTLAGGCHCGNIRLELKLSQAPVHYQPRACDCDFCTPHNAAWLSDPEGALTLRIGDEAQLSRYRQGSGQAEFLLCANCGVLAAVLFAADGSVHGAVNARAVDGAKGFGAPQPVSPQSLSPEQKARRWQDVWFRDVKLQG